MAGNSTALWMLLFFSLFYMYIEVWLQTFREELRMHYLICEKLIRKRVEHISLMSQSGTGGSHHIDSLKPTADEIAEGYRAVRGGAPLREVFTDIPLGRDNIDASLVWDYPSRRPMHTEPDMSNVQGFNFGAYRA